MLLFFTNINLGYDMTFPVEKLKKTAYIMRLQLTDEELAGIQIDWLDAIKSIDTTGIEPLITVAEHPLPLRADIVTEGGYRDKILKNAPDKSGNAAGYFAVPKMLEE
jgi:aspartyl-tRNA(Asn)/glutamyl-tRNA(Gln) amidotransferase subunit C